MKWYDENRKIMSPKRRVPRGWYYEKMKKKSISLTWCYFSRSKTPILAWKVAFLLIRKSTGSKTPSSSVNWVYLICIWASLAVWVPSSAMARETSLNWEWHKEREVPWIQCPQETNELQTKHKEHWIKETYSPTPLYVGAWPAKGCMKIWTLCHKRLLAIIHETLACEGRYCQIESTSSVATKMCIERQKKAKYNSELRTWTWIGENSMRPDVGCDIPTFEIGWAYDVISTL